MAFCTSLMICASFSFLKNRGGKICIQGAFKRTIKKWWVWPGLVIVSLYVLYTWEGFSDLEKIFHCAGFFRTLM